MTLDPRKGQIPEVGKMYRVTMIDLEWHERADEGILRITKIRPPSETIEDHGYHAVYLTDVPGSAVCRRGLTGTANFYGRDWYRLFTEVPPIQSVGRFL